ncbi:PrsW family intramembrane metalloprotease [Actinosynnema sp. NPDC051121]
MGLIALGLCGLVLFGLGTGETGAGAILVGAVAALVPVVVVVGAFLWVGRWEPEPARSLLLAFFWGACGATAISAVLNQVAYVLGEAVLAGGSTFVAVVAAPVVEEAAKAAFAGVLFLRRRQEFGGPVDGVVYAGIAAAGFAFTENVYYFARVFADTGLGDLSSGLAAVFVLRGALSPFAHPLFTVMVGIGIGVAATTGSKRLRVAAPLLGYLGATGLHSLWNTSAIVGDGSTFISLYFLVMVPVFAGVVWLVVWQRRRERRILTEQLPEMVANRWIAASEVPLLSSRGRRRWRRVVRRKFGTQAASAVAGYQEAVTELAFLRHRLRPGTSATISDTRHDTLLSSLVTARDAAVETLRPATHGRTSAPSW